MTAAPIPAVMPVCDQANTPFAGGTEIALLRRKPPTPKESKQN